MLTLEKMIPQPAEKLSSYATQIHNSKDTLDPWLLCNVTNGPNDISSFDNWTVKLLLIVLNTEKETLQLC